MRRYWLDEVARVMPDWQKEDARRTRARRSNFGGFRSGGGGEVATDEDYCLLGLARDPPPTAAASECAACHAWPSKANSALCVVHRSWRRIPGARDDGAP